MGAYYNEFKPEAAHMLRQLIKDGLIADGTVDDRSITDVRPEDLKGFTQCHFFAGIGGWSVALRQAGWTDDRPVWTGSCPCQPFSTAGKQKGKEDERHLWPIWAKLIAEVKPPIIFGEQVSSAISHGWLDGVYTDMEAQGYACGSAVLPACAVDAPHKRDRLWFVAHSECDGQSAGEIGRGFESTADEQQAGQHNATNTERTSNPGMLAYIGNEGLQGAVWEGAAGTQGTSDGYTAERSFWSDCDWIICGDGKARRIPTAQSGICIVAHGLQHRTPLLHALGNAIVPEVASRFIKACM